MASRWQVFKDGELLGVMTAPEIRQALRDGVIDPFDQVVREGSGLRVELVEVDEIFDPSRDQMTAIDGQAGSRVQQLPQVQVSVNFHGNEGSQLKSQAVAYAPIKEPQAYAVPPGGGVFSNVENTNSALAMQRKDPKRFFLIDRNKQMLGPLSGAEVQSMFYRGMLSKGVRVQKQGESKMVPVQQFVAIYAGNMVSEMARDARGSGMQPAYNLKSSRFLNQFYRGVSVNSMSSRSLGPYLVVIAVGMLLGFAVYLLVQIGYNREKRNENQRRARAKTEAVSRRSSREDRRLSLRLKELTTPKPPEVRKRSTVVEKPRRTQETRKRDDDDVVFPTLSLGQREAPRPTKKPPRAARVEAAPPNEPLAPATTPPPPREAPKRPAGGGNASGLQEGQVATLSGVTFKVAELAKCGAKCRLTLYKSQSAVITAVFFKAAFEEELSSRLGESFTVVGTVKKEGNALVLFLQSVR